MTAAPRILLLLEHRANRELLTEHLNERYEVISASLKLPQRAALASLLHRSFDLCILDGPTLDRIGEAIQARRELEQPVYWCPDCKMLDLAMKNGSCAFLLARDFQIVKVNVGHFDKNLDIAKLYGVSLARGIPAIAILSSDGKVLYVTREGELANARDMGEAGIYKFFKRVTAAAKAKE